MKEKCVCGGPVGQSLLVTKPARPPPEPRPEGLLKEPVRDPVCASQWAAPASCTAYCKSKKIHGSPCSFRAGREVSSCWGAAGARAPHGCGRVRSPSLEPGGLWHFHLWLGRASLDEGPILDLLERLCSSGASLRGRRGRKGLQTTGDSPANAASGW